jgi:hypothetical protein
MVATTQDFIGQAEGGDREGQKSRRTEKERPILLLES